MYTISEHEHVVFRSEDIDDIKEFLEEHVDKYDYDFLEYVDEYINDNSDFDIVGLSDWDWSAAEILKNLDESAYDDVVIDQFEEALDRVIYEIVHYSSEEYFFGYYVRDVEEEPSVEMIRVFARNGEHIRLEDIFETKEKAEMACDELNFRAWRAKDMTSYFVGGEDYRPTTAQIMMGL